MKILVIDDEPLIRRALQKFFEQKGHNVRCESDGLKGLGAWREFDPDFVFLDVILPQVSGPQVFLQRPSKKARVAMMTAYSGSQELQVDSVDKPDYFLEKPFQDIQDLLILVENMRET